MSNLHITAVSRADLSRTALPARHRHTAKSVLKVFADYANENNRSYPHVATIALEAGCGKNAVSRATEECVRANLLRKRKTRNGNHYVLNMRLLKEIEVPRRKRRDPEFPEFDDTDLHESNEPPEEPPPEQETGGDQAFPRRGETGGDQAFPRDGETVSPSRGTGFPVVGNGFPRDGEQIPYLSLSDPPTNQGGPANEPDDRSVMAGWLEGQDNEGEDATSSPAKDSQPWGSSETSSDPDGVRLLRSLPRGVGQALTGSAVSGWSHVIGEALQSGMSEQVITDKLTSGLPDDDREKRVRIVVGRRLPDLQATIAEPVQHQQTSPSEAAHAQVDRMAGRGEHGAREAAGKLGEHWDPEQHRGEVGAREWMLEILPELSREFVEQRREALVRVLTSGNAA